MRTVRHRSRSSAPEARRAITFAWQPVGTGDAPADEADFVDGDFPVTAEFSDGEQSIRIARIAGDNRAEPDETFGLLLTPITAEIGFGPSLA